MCQRVNGAWPSKVFDIQKAIISAYDLDYINEKKPALTRVQTKVRAGNVYVTRDLDLCPVDSKNKWVSRTRRGTLLFDDPTAALFLRYHAEEQTDRHTCKRG